MMPMGAFAANPDLKPFRTAIDKQRDEAIKRLQGWIAVPSIAAENLNSEEGAKIMAELAKDAGFQSVTRIASDGKPGVFATWDVGAPVTIGLYFMYDVKQFDPKEWSEPPLEAKVVERPKLGKVMIGRGAVNQKGPEATFLAALHAMRATGQKPPVNLVLVAEGEEEIGSPHFPQIIQKPEVMAALSKCACVFMPSAGQDADGGVSITLGAKGIIELELVATGARWGRGPDKDIHSSLKAMVDSPAWHLVAALQTLTSADGNAPAIDGWFENVRPLSAREREIIAEGVAKQDEATVKRQLGVQRWLRDMNFLAASENLASQPTVNIEGLVAGYTGPGGKTILPSKAVAKIDLRLVPNQTTTECLAKLKAHLEKRGFGDIEVNMTGGYNPTETAEKSSFIQSEMKLYRALGVEPRLFPRSAGSWPGFVFTDPPLKLAAGHFGMGHGSGAHAPNEYYVIEAANPKVQGMADATLSYIQFLYALAG
jgi:acetylornithine deacetylase/succinyl-diaminopimelate desuccinylase-like protein